MKNKPIKTTVNSLKKDLKLINDDTYLILTNEDNQELIIDNAYIPFLGGINMTLSNAYKLYFSIEGLLHKEVIIPDDMLFYYVDLFLSASSNVEYTNIKLLASHQFKEGSKIEFPPDKAGRVKIGKISPINKKYCGIYYKILKKDGSLGKKELTLYGGIDYKLLDRDFIDYKKFFK